MSTGYHIIKLNFQTPLHIGLGKDNYDFSSSELHADTLTSALASTRAINGKADDLKDFLQSFTLSSAFPFHNREYFLPKPVGRIPVKVKGLEETAYRKNLKSIKFIESSIWEKIMKGEEVEVTAQQLQGDFLINENAKFVKPYQHQVSQRAFINRINESDTTPFFFDWTYFSEDCGLYCLTDANGDLLNEIIQLFTQLGENGIGSDRSVGGGHFTVSTDTINISTCNNEGQLMLLSPYIPTENEHKALNWDESKFSLIKRGGYIAGSCSEQIRHYWKRSVYMVNEGSIIKGLNEIEGKVIDLAPAESAEFKSVHPVLRSGRAFYIPVKMKQ